MIAGGPRGKGGAAPSRSAAGMGRGRAGRGGPGAALWGASGALLLVPGGAAAGALLGGAAVSGCSWSLGKVCSALGGSCSAMSECGGLWVPAGCGFGLGGCGCCHPPWPDADRPPSSSWGADGRGFGGDVSGGSSGSSVPSMFAAGGEPPPGPPSREAARPAQPRPAQTPPTVAQPVPAQIPSALSPMSEQPPLPLPVTFPDAEAIELLLRDLLDNLTIPVDGGPVSLTVEQLRTLLEGVGIQLDAPIDELLEQGRISGGVNDSQRQIVLDFQGLLGPGSDATVAVDCTVGCEVLSDGAEGLPLLQYYYDVEQEEGGGAAEGLGRRS